MMKSFNYKMIRIEYRLEHKYIKARSSKKEKCLKEYEAGVVQSSTAIDFYDTFYILYTCLLKNKRSIKIVRILCGSN